MSQEQQQHPLNATSITTRRRNREGDDDESEQAAGKASSIDDNNKAPQPLNAGEDCSLCSIVNDDQSKKHISTWMLSPCGHCFCESCASAIMLRCPTCRALATAKTWLSASEIREAILREARDALSQTKDALAMVQSALSSTSKELFDTKRQLTDAKQQLADVSKQLSDAKKSSSRNVGLASSTYLMRRA